ncbi:MULTISPECIES: hypothetical protein [unclassified Nostoc]|nr:hypothetical protein [Nostoc sp. JL33]
MVSFNKRRVMPPLPKEPKYQKNGCCATIFYTAFLAEIHIVDTRKPSAIA